MADIAFFCLTCGKRNDAPAAYAGRKVQCRYCQKPVLVPQQAFITEHERDAADSAPAFLPQPPASVPVERHARWPATAPNAARAIARPIVTQAQAALSPAEHPEPQASREERREMLTSTTAWAISLMIHVLLFLSFVGANLLGLGSGKGDGVGGGSGRKVGIVEESGAAIKSVEPPVTERRPADVSSEFAIPVINLAGAEPQPAESAPAARPIIGGLATGSGAGEGSGAGNGSGSGSGTGGKAGFFGLHARGQTFVYVVDQSGSMQGRKLDILKAELIESIGSLSPTMKFFVISYGDDYSCMRAGGIVPSGPVAATAANKRKYLEWVRTIQCFGLTNPVGAMRHAIALKPDVIWLMTDGEFNRMADDNGNYMEVEPRQATNAIIAANVDRRTPGGCIAAIHTICFWSQEAEGEMKRIAASSRGRYRYVSPSQAMRKLGNAGGQ